MLDVEALSEMMAGIIAEEVGKAVAPLNARIAELEGRSMPDVVAGEPGKDGTSVTIEDVAPIISAEVERAVAFLPKPKDGKDAAGIVEALKDSGELVLTLQDGRLVRTGIRDGEKGKDGSDGLGFDDLDACVLDDDRTIELCFRRGDEEKAFTFKWPTVIYRNVFKEGEQYERGDMVTWAGSLWHCDTPTKDKPGTDNWTLAAKKGRDGKDAKVG